MLNIVSGWSVSLRLELGSASISWFEWDEVIYILLFFKVTSILLSGLLLNEHVHIFLVILAHVNATWTICHLLCSRDLVLWFLKRSHNLNNTNDEYKCSTYCEWPTEVACSLKDWCQYGSKNWPETKCTSVYRTQIIFKTILLLNWIKFYLMTQNLVESRYTVVVN